LDLGQGVFKYAKQPNEKQTVINFRDISGMEVDPLLASGSFVDRNYSHYFKIIMPKRDMILAAKNLTDRQMWINGFNVLFEFREQQNNKLSSIIPGGLQSNTVSLDKKIQ
jgi:hypothetical protein